MNLTPAQAKALRAWVRERKTLERTRRNKPRHALIPAMEQAEEAAAQHLLTYFTSKGDAVDREGRLAALCCPTHNIPLEQGPEPDTYRCPRGDCTERRHHIPSNEVAP